MPDSIPKIKYPELIFGLVAPIGADPSPVISALKQYFEGRQYRVVEIKVTGLFSVLEKYITPKKNIVHRSPLKDRYETYIAYGNQLREDYGDSILAAATIRRVMTKRLKVSTQSGPPPYSKTVYILHQFKRKEEVDLLRAVYGRLFYQVSIYSRKGARVDYLARTFASSANRLNAKEFRDSAEALVNTDENEAKDRHGQRVAKVFHDADVIISLDGNTGDWVKKQVNRFCELIFGSNSISPTHREYGMFLAKAAALRTLDLSRQVGAAIFSEEGEVLALGSNEVPKGGGGTYWTHEEYDDRDYTRKADSNFKRKKEILAELLEYIDPNADIEIVLQQQEIKDSQFMDALEYGRIVHAEMCALSDAARLGHAVRGGTLYCTTFPCHMCAKHIVASGISQVIFLEPYPKSLAFDLHSDSIEIEEGDRGAYNKYPRVSFDHFYGVSPRRYRELFERASRKIDDGTFSAYICEDPSPNIDIKFPFYSRLEEIISDKAMERLYLVADKNEISES